MKKEWKKPELEVLDVNETMHGKDGNTLMLLFDQKLLKGY